MFAKGANSLSETHSECRHPFRGLWVLLCVLAFMGGCESGSTSAPPSSSAAGGVGTPVSMPVVTPGVDGLPLSDGVTPFKAKSDEYWLDEDTSLAGVLVVIPINATAPEIADRVSPGESDIVFQLLRQPQHGSLEVMSGGKFTYTPNADFFGDDSFEFYAWEGQTGSLPATVKLHIRPLPDAPKIVASVASVVEQGADYRVEFIASDVDGDSLEFEALNLPVWLDIDAESGWLTGSPDQSDVGVHTGISISVMDSSGLRTQFKPFAIEVIDINDSPTLNPSHFPSRMDARETVTVSVFPDDLDGDMVSVITELNDFVDVTVRGGTLDVTAKDVIEVTDINLVVIAEDRLGSVRREVLPITLYPVTKSGKGRTLIGRKYGDGVHLVVLGDGYKADELDEYEQHVEELIDLMREDPAVNMHFSAWNIHTVSTPSIDSGIDDNVLEDYRQTEFNAGFFCSGIPRLICADELHVFRTALADYPHLDHIVLLVNDPRYGGSGGAAAIASVTAMEVAVHELGHSVAHLADEYADEGIDPGLYTDFTEGEFANVSFRNSPETVPWSHWIGNVNRYPTQPNQPGVGIFEGGYYRSTGVYRPTFDSRMRTNDSHFGPVNGEQWALSVYRIAHPVRDFGPTSRRIESAAGVALNFFVAPLFDSALQSVTWSFDGDDLAAGTDPNTLEILPTAGLHQLELRVEDISGMIRKPTPHEGYFRWTWELVIQ